MKQRQRWPAELRAAIDAADAEGIPANRILKLARNGELDGISQPFKIPQSTFFDILAKGRAARIASTEPVAPGEEEQAANAILRRAIELAQREIAKLDAELADKRKTDAEKTQLTRRLEILIRMVRSYETKGRGEQGRSKSSIHRAQEESNTRASTPLGTLVAEQERKLRQRTASDPTSSDEGEAGSTSANGTSNGTRDDNVDGHDDHLSRTLTGSVSSH